MPELKPCPNPKCMGKAPIIKEGARIDIVCPNCLLALPAPLGSLEWLVDQWNALPSALRWTHEPPKVAGWYWWRDVSHKGEATIQYMSQSQVERLKTYPGEEWAGPILTPRELEES